MSWFLAWEFSFGPSFRLFLNLFSLWTAAWEVGELCDPCDAARCCCHPWPTLSFFPFLVTSDTLDFSYMLTQSSYAYQHHRLVLSLWNSLLSFLRTLRLAIFGNDFMQKLPFVVLLPILSSLSPSPQTVPEHPYYQLPTTHRREFLAIFSIY